MINTFETTDGELRRNSRRRWVLNEFELTSGSHLQVKIQNHWIDVVIEHDHSGYYAIPYAVRLHQGLHARFPNQWGD